MLLFVFPINSDSKPAKKFQEGRDMSKQKPVSSTYFNCIVLYS